MKLDEAIKDALRLLIGIGEEINPEKWQGVKPPQPMIEVLNVTVTADMDTQWPANLIRPNLPWANDHFEERVSGKPLNPGETFRSWPYYAAKPENDRFREDSKFSHTYMERFWPKHAGRSVMHGIRGPYGDLQDVANLLIREPDTRQAFLPVWFPEDTGNITGVRVPCTIGYHFILRNERLHCVYYIRSCDALRHFRDDVYLAWKLSQWIITRLLLNDPERYMKYKLGELNMHITSFHCFKGDLPILEAQLK